jgi:hypothetical protein
MWARPGAGDEPNGKARARGVASRLGAGSPDARRGEHQRGEQAAPGDLLNRC